MWPAQLVIRIAYHYCHHVFLSSCTFIQQACPTVRTGLSTNRGRGKRWLLRLWKKEPLHCTVYGLLPHSAHHNVLHSPSYVCNDLARLLPWLHMNTNKTMLPRSKPLLFRPWWEALHGTSRLWIPNESPIGNKDSCEYFAWNRSNFTLSSAGHWYFGSENSNAINHLRKVGWYLHTKGVNSTAVCGFGCKIPQ